jgi:hypothetical protein
MDLRQPGGQQQLRDTRSGSMPANSAPVCESIRAADGTEVTESAELQRCSVSITSSWVPTGVRRVRPLDRDS